MLSVLAAAIVIGGPPPARACQPEGVTEVATPALLYRQGDRPASMERLDRLPPAKGELTVLRSVAGCMVPTQIGTWDEQARRLK